MLVASLSLLACGSWAKPVGVSSQTPLQRARCAWAVGAHGTILATTDGGAHWVRQQSGTTLVLCGAAFADASHGWIIGNRVNAARTGASDSVILATSDGGQQWTTVRSLSLGPDGCLDGLACAGPDDVWVVGAQSDGSGLILASTDGGATWHQQPADLPPDSGGVWRVAFVDASHGWACTGDSVGGCLLHTADGGAHWQIDTPLPGTGTIDGLAPAGPTSCWALADRKQAEALGDGYSPALLHADSHGLTWKALPDDVLPDGIFAITDSRLGGISTAPGPRFGCTFSSSSDGGSHWTAPVGLPIMSGLVSAAAFSDANHGWILGYSSDHPELVILRTTDGGLTWKSSYFVRVSMAKVLCALACPGNIGSLLLVG